MVGWCRAFCSVLRMVRSRDELPPAWIGSQLRHGSDYLIRFPLLISCDVSRSGAILPKPAGESFALSFVPCALSCLNCVVRWSQPPPAFEGFQRSPWLRSNRYRRRCRQAVSVNVCWRLRAGYCPDFLAPERPVSPGRRLGLQQRRQRLRVAVRCAGVADDTSAGAVLRGLRAQPQCAQHDGDELCRHGGGGGAVGAVRLQPGLCAGQRPAGAVHRRPAVGGLAELGRTHRQRPVEPWDGGPVSGHLRDHHAGVGVGGGGGADAVPGLVAVPCALEPARV